jgi:uncharacterized protein (DUF362 family)
MERRRFLQLIGLASLAAGGCGRARGKTGGLSALAPAAAGGAAAGSPAQDGQARVVVVRSSRWRAQADVESLRAGLKAALRSLTGAEPAEAWRRFCAPTDNVAIKVNCLAGPALCTSPELVKALVEELGAAQGRQRLWVYDRTSAELEECGYQLSHSQTDLKCAGSDEVGYEEEVTVSGETGTWFSLIVARWADVIINMPVAKDHDLAGISGALKNHLGSISNPNKLHEPDLARAIVDVASAPVIADKQRLVVYDLLRVCYDGGPAFKPATTVRYGAILLAEDPVAADAVVVSIMDKLRGQAGLPSLWERAAKPSHVQIAGDGQHRLGCADLKQIELVEVEV